VGADKYADMLRTKNAEAGVRSEYLVEPSQPTGRCGVIITDHNRSMCTHLAAANEYKLSHLKSPEIWSLVEQADFYYVGGYHFTVCPPAIMALAEEAAAKNKVFALGMGAPFIAQFFKDPLDQTAPYWDYILMNETEAAAWADGHGLEGEKDVTKIARKIADLPKINQKRKRTVVITQGTDETVVAVQGENGVKTFPVHVVSKEEINDTNGAGYVFFSITCSILINLVMHSLLVSFPALF
jgi:adenosine kinase